MKSGSTTPRRRHRPALIALVVIAAVACLLLAWWQWSRFESASGTAQNLGYALQWPAFAVAVIWAYRRFVVLENTPDDERAASADRKGVTEIPAGILPDRPTTPSASSLSTTSSAREDSALAEYNSYLADLNDRPSTTDRNSEDRRP